MVVETEEFGGVMSDFIDTYYWGTVADVAAEVDSNLVDYAMDCFRDVPRAKVLKKLIGIYAIAGVDGMLDRPYTAADKADFAAQGIKLVRV